MLGCPGMEGGGGIIRDCLGRWVKGFTRATGWANSLETVLWAIRDGLTLCILLHIQAIEIEIDASNVVILLSNNENSYAEFAPIVDDCRTC